VGGRQRGGQAGSTEWFDEACPRYLRGRKTGGGGRIFFLQLQRKVDGGLWEGKGCLIYRVREGTHHRAEGRDWGLFMSLWTEWGGALN